MHASCEWSGRVPLQTLCAAPVNTAHYQPLKIQPGYGTERMLGKYRSKMHQVLQRPCSDAQSMLCQARPCVIGAVT